MKKVLMMLAVAVLAFGVGQAQAAPIVIDFAGFSGGSVVVNGGTYTGSNIPVGFLQLINTPQNSGSYTTNAVMNFAYGGGDNWVNIVGGFAPAGLEDGSILLSGTFSSFNVGATPNGISIQAGGPDTKNPVLLTFAGLPVDTQFVLFGMTMDMSTDTSGVSKAISSSMSNTAVPDPGSTLLLLGMGLTGLVAVRRRWRR
jgi:hypothetical protein